MLPAGGPRGDKAMLHNAARYGTGSARPAGLFYQLFMIDVDRVRTQQLCGFVRSAAMHRMFQQAWGGWTRDPRVCEGPYAMRAPPPLSTPPTNQNSLHTLHAWPLYSHPSLKPFPSLTSPCPHQCLFTHHHIHPSNQPLHIVPCSHTAAPTPPFTSLTPLSPHQYSLTHHHSHPSQPSSRSLLSSSICAPTAAASTSPE